MPTFASTSATLSTTGAAADLSKPNDWSRVRVAITGTHANWQFKIEGSADGDAASPTWYDINAVAVSDRTVQSVTLTPATNTDVVWECDGVGYNHVRVNVSSAGTGSPVVRVESFPMPAVQPVNTFDALTATATELNRATDVSGRLVAAGSTLTLTETTHEGKIICLDTAAGSTITLPAATGSGAKYKFVVTVAPSSNQHRINVVGDDAFVGSANLLDRDGSAQAAFSAASGSDVDRINMNGTTQGGLIGDTVEIIDVLADRWHVFAQLVVPAGSNPATPFATGQVS